MMVFMYDEERHITLCVTPHGKFCWDKYDKMVVLVDPYSRQVRGAGAWVVRQDANGVWHAEPRPAPRPLDSEEMIG